MGMEKLKAVIPGGASVPCVRGGEMREALMDFDYLGESWALAWELQPLLLWTEYRCNQSYLASF